MIFETTTELKKGVLDLFLEVTERAKTGHIGIIPDSDNLGSNLLHYLTIVYHDS